ncbi:MAG: RsmB/NOP family class I SAM-dependent RNA methyltransferase [Pseudomonadota bacterium]
MTPAARLQSAIMVLDAWLSGRPLEVALTGWARGARYAGSSDRRAVRDHVYDIVRQLGVCAHLGGGVPVQEADGRMLVLGALRLSGADIPALFTGDRYAPGKLSPAEERRLADPFEIERHRDTPAWLRPRLAAALGPDLDTFEAAMAARAPLYLRVNIQRSDRAGAAAALAKDGITALPEPGCATALRVTDGARRVTAAGAFAAGLVEPQDLSPQMACAEVPWDLGPILDYCAGGGGKSLAIAAATGQRVDVHDISPSRMADLPSRAARAGADLRIVAQPEPGYGTVLVDVPCSGSGTWRRDPETRWRLTERRLAALIRSQAAILDDASALVRPQGRLIYMTCSVLDDENAAQTRAFLARHPRWRLGHQRLFMPPSASDGFFCATLLAP